ncbi:MAG: hypothetical protein H7841_07110 [Magnetospirillum sp. WYHS-4]
MTAFAELMDTAAATWRSASVSGLRPSDSVKDVEGAIKDLRATCARADTDMAAVSKGSLKDVAAYSEADAVAEMSLAQGGSLSALLDEAQADDQARIAKAGVLDQAGLRDKAATQAKVDAAFADSVWSLQESMVAALQAAAWGKKGTTLAQDVDDLDASSGEDY